MNNMDMIKLLGATGDRNSQAEMREAFQKYCRENKLNPFSVEAISAFGKLSYVDGDKDDSEIILDTIFGK